MTRRAGLLSAIRYLTLITLLLSMPGLARAQEEEEGGSASKWPERANVVNLLEPIGALLSGRPWLMSVGMEPSLLTGPTQDGQTGIDFGPLGGTTASSGAGSGGRQGGPGVLVPFRNPAPAFSSNVLITRDFSSSTFQTEPHLAVDPSDPDHLVLGTIDYNFPSMSSYVSLDGGETWEGPNQSPYLIDDQFSGGDPVLAFDRAGSVYMASISIGEEEFTVGPVAVSSAVSSIAVARSDDGGFSWPENISTARSRVSTDGLQPDRFGRLRGNLTIGFLDKPWMAIGPDPRDPTRDIIYVSYTDFNVNYEVLWLGEFPTLLATATTTTIRLVRSEDGGRTWSNPVAVSPTVNQGYGGEGAPSDVPGVFGTKRTVQGSQPVVGPNGNVYVAWLDSTDDEAMKGSGEIYVARSTDAGATFTAPLFASSFNEIGFRPRNAFFRYWASEFPQLAVGPEGELYLVYVAKPSDRPRDDGDTYIVASFDDGETWSRPKRLNDDDGTAVQFFPSVDVDPNGAIHVMWGDMRDDPAETRYQIYYTRSDDKGETWGFEIPDLDLRTGDTRVSDFGSNPNRGFPRGLFIGDYFSIQATADEVYMVWSDTRLGEFGAPNQKISFARRRAIAGPDLFLSPAAGPGGQQVTLQGFGYQPDLNVFVQLGDSTVTTARTDREGSFTARLYMPVTSEGDQPMTAVDESGNVGTTSYFTEFGFGNIQELYNDLARQIEEVKTLVAATGSGAVGSPEPSVLP